jgi:hypothetical protein
LPPRRAGGGTRTTRTPPSTWVRGSDIVAWAGRRDAQDALPEVVRRLVLATTEHPSRVAFRAGEGVQLGGWDGIVVTERPNAFVPAGTSYWELSTTSRARQKAGADYAKRTAETPEAERQASTCVLVTAQRWVGKDAWVRVRQGEGAWREVVAYDADDLEAWLGLAPAVHLWFSLRLGTVPEGAVDLATAWTEWSAATEPELPPEFFLAGRAETVKAIREWLQQPARPLAIRAESRAEAVAIVAAVLRALPTDEGDATFSRAAVVREANAWRGLVGSQEPLLLLPTFDGGDLIAAAARAGHGVIIPLGEGDPPPNDVTQVPPVGRQAAAEVLKSLGVEHHRAYELAGLARRSMTALRRRLALSAALQRPVWAQPANARTILPALLAGGWSEGQPPDREVLSALSRAPYEDVRDRLVRWAQDADPPLRRRGDAWFIVSKQDAWALLSGFLNRDDLERLESAALSVLGTPDPKFDLPPERRWMAGALGHSAVHSGLLQRGLASTLAVMGASADNGGEAPNAPRSFAASVVRQLLGKANTDWRLWASLAPHLPDLAEASPDAFLTAVEAGLRGEKPVLQELFTDTGDQLFSSSPHTGLLWALERLAWSPAYLGRTALTLARLATRDPDGKLSNRPAESLAAIYRPWLPQTAASLDQRLATLDMLREREPGVAWALMQSMLPQLRAVGSYSARPEWRDWAPDAERKVTRGEYAAAIAEVVRRMLVDARTEGSRWGALIDVLPVLPPNEHALVAERLRQLDAHALSPADNALIWEHLRRLIADHRAFGDADWAMPAEAVERLDGLRSRFEPTDPVARYGWLFGHNATLPEGFPDGEHNWEAREAAVQSARTEALSAVINSSGLESVLLIADHADQPDRVGWTAGRLPELRAQEDEILRLHLAAPDGKRAGFGWGYAAARAQDEGRDWVIGKLEGVAKGWSAEQQAILLHLLGANREAWERASKIGAETERAYWRQLHPFRVSAGDADDAARHLVAAGRPNAAVGLLGLHAREELTNPELAMEVLAAALTSDPQHDPLPSQVSYDMARLLDQLASRRDVDQSRVAMLEWRLLPIVSRLERRPKALSHLVAQNPTFFVEVVTLVFSGEGEEPRELTSEDRARAERGYDLLHSWSVVPGQGVDGTIDEAAMRKWIEVARKDLAATGRGVVGDQMIGEALSSSRADPDGTWPSRPVRNVIDELQNDDIEKGFVIGVLNSRGVTTRDPAAGGIQERGLAERYEGLASAVADRWPRTAGVLRRIAETYRAEARHEDLESALDEDLGA